ncbi:Uncharacterised protein [Candidatus Anstonella stagnisolia]|nr:Uncharacterised protein [Candidatus Anstonella stagnisolia]
MKDRKKIAFALLLIIAVSSSLITISWVLGVSPLLNFTPGTPTRLTTSFSFLLASILLYFIFERQEKNTELNEFAIPVITTVLLIIFFPLFVAQFFGINIGFEQLISGVSPISGISASPNVVTMFAFFIVVFAGSAVSFNPNEREITRVSGVALCLIGLCALAGYAFGIPIMYYSFDGQGVEMALQTAFAFTLLGAAFFLAGGEGGKTNAKRGVAT